MSLLKEEEDSNLSDSEWSRPTYSNASRSPSPLSEPSASLLLRLPRRTERASEEHQTQCHKSTTLSLEF